MNFFGNPFVIKFGNFLSKQIEENEHQLVVDCLEEGN